MIRVRLVKIRAKAVRLLPPINYPPHTRSTCFFLFFFSSHHATSTSSSQHWLHNMTRTLADTIAQASINLYDTLRPHGKPAKRPNGVEEWTVLATICLVLPDSFTVTPVSLGTGVKVLPANRLPPLGDAVHDCHAEVLARRGFVRWLLEEASKVVKSDAAENESRAAVWFDELEGKFRFKQGVEVWLYVSTLPVSCSDIAPLALETSKG